MFVICPCKKNGKCAKQPYENLISQLFGTVLWVSVAPAHEVKMDGPHKDLYPLLA